MLLIDEALIYNIIKFVVLGIGFPVFIALFFIKAGYGRYTTKKWGPAINQKLGWIIMESVPPILFLIFYLISERKSEITLIIFLVIWEIHYIQRAFIYPFLMRGKKKIPIVIITMGIIFNSFNAYIQGRYLYTLSALDKYTIDWLTTPQFIIGVILFLIGYFINLSSDSILRHLRNPKEKDGYKIPYGGLFEKISCPNYFGEIVEWIGWTILTWSFTGLVFAVWTMANLMPRSISHHKWYHNHFEDYPKDRKAIIPYLF